MSEARQIIMRVAGFHEGLSADLDKHGGYLRCESCGRERPLRKGDAGRYTSVGWPRHCGYTMMWWTQRQIDAGEVPELSKH